MHAAWPFGDMSGGTSGIGEPTRAQGYAPGNSGDLAS